MNRPGEGITAMARCSSYKRDSIKNTTSLAITIRIEDQDGEGIGSGINLNINNLSPEKESMLLKILGIERISEVTPFAVQLDVLKKDDDKKYWNMKMAEEEKEIPPEQSKLEGAPEAPKKDKEAPAPSTNQEEKKKGDKPKGSAAIAAIAQQKKETKTIEDAAAKIEMEYIDKLTNLAKELKIKNPGKLNLKDLEKAITEAGGELPKLQG